MHPIAWFCLICIGYAVVSVAVRTWKIERGKRRKNVLRQAGLFALFYLGAMLMLMWIERYFIFHPTPYEANWRPPTTVAFEEIRLDTPQGHRIHAFWCPVPNAKWTIHYSHGNAGHAGARLNLVHLWQKHLGASVLIYDYPGYGHSTGTLDEASCYAAGQACYDWLRSVKKVPPEQIVIYGKSLGCAPATEMAMRNPHRALMLMAPFCSIPDMAAEMFPIFPTRWMARTKFDNAAKLAEYKGVLLIGHGTEDPVVPFRHGQRLDAAAIHARKKKFLIFDGFGHMAPPENYYQEAAQLLKETPKEVIPPAGS
jgi:uncharacterized protein